MVVPENTFLGRAWKWLHPYVGWSVAIGIVCGTVFGITNVVVNNPLTSAIVAPCVFVGIAVLMLRQTILDAIINRRETFIPVNAVQPSGKERACPFCGGIMEIAEDTPDGQHVRCPYCEGKSQYDEESDCLNDIISDDLPLADKPLFSDKQKPIGNSEKKIPSISKVIEPPHTTSANRTIKAKRVAAQKSQFMSSVQNAGNENIKEAHFHREDSPKHKRATAAKAQYISPIAGISKKAE